MRNLKRALSLGLTAAMISGLMVMGSSAASYADVTSENNVEAIDVLEAVGIMIGDENGNFNPDQNVTRNEMAVVMANLMEYNVASYQGHLALYRCALLGRALRGRLLDQRHHRWLQRHHLWWYRHRDHRSGRPDADEGSGLLPVRSDFGSDWQLATTRQGNAIDLFVGVDSGVTQAMTRNDVAQLVLNTLEAGTVTASTDGSWSIGDVTIANNVTYNYVTSNQTYATAIARAGPPTLPRTPPAPLLSWASSCTWAI